MKPTIPDFTPTKFHSNADKQKFARHFIRFVESDFNFNLFYHWFYVQLSFCREHIAHYNKWGFYDAQFSTEERREAFLKHWMVAPIYGDPAFTYSDAERFLTDWLKNRFYADSRGGVWDTKEGI